MTDEAVLRTQIAAEIRHWAVTETVAQSTWLWCELGEERLCAVADRIARSVDGSGPRRWRMPEIPDDVKAVRDRDGELWTREKVDGSWRHQDDDPDMAGLPEEELLTFGPLVEYTPCIVGAGVRDLGTKP